LKSRLVIQAAFYFWPLFIPYLKHHRHAIATRPYPTCQPLEFRRFPTVCG
jgi:hypothetical protein